MKILNRFLIPVFVLLVLTSCDTLFSSKGQVIDKETRQPLSEVKINMKNIDTVYTDSAGYYSYRKVMHGSAGALEMLLSKEGYQKQARFFSIRKSRPAEYVD